MSEGMREEKRVCEDECEEQAHMSECGKERNQ